jgi:hypothetical protein
MQVANALRLLETRKVGRHGRADVEEVLIAVCAGTGKAVLEIKTAQLRFDLVMPSSTDFKSVR